MTDATDYDRYDESHLLKGRPVDLGRLENGVRYEEPLARIKETRSEWRLGSVTVDKRECQGGTGWRLGLTAESCFFKFPATVEGKAVIGVVMRMWTPPDGATIEYLAGWVPADREAEADNWIGFLNAEIAKRLAGRAP